MGNKYAAHSQAARLREHKRRMCDRKVRYKSYAEASVIGQKVYSCPYCDGFHCSAAFQKLVNQVSRNDR